MSLEYYTRNLDYYGNQSRSDTPRNCVLDVVFGDEQSTNGQPSGLLTLVYTATGGEASFQNDLIINATAVALTRDGLDYTPVTEFSATAKKEFKLTAGTGEIVFHPDLPVMNADEDSVLRYVPEGASSLGLTEPITLAQAKAWLKVTHDDEDVIITALITAARQTCEGYISKSFVERTVTAIVRNDLGNIKLPYGPVNTVTSAADSEGGEYGSGDYNITGISDKRLGYPMASYVKVVYTAGYSVLPEQFKTAIKMQLSWMYTHRGDDEGTVIAPDAKAILSPYRSVV